MTEEDTFLKLKQAPFEEAVVAWQRTLGNGESVQQAIEALKKLGWSLNEYTSEWNKRKFS